MKIEVIYRYYCFDYQASRYLPIGTTIEISPVLLFSEKEYRDHGQYTLLDHYTFIWGDGRMALPLGLGTYLPNLLKQNAL
jgi:hypothetical protein